MNLFAQLTERSWESKTAAAHVSVSTGKVHKSGLRLLMLVISVLFLLFFVAFLMRSQYPDWQPLAEEPSHPLFNPAVLWLNTLYLFLASICIEICKRRIVKSHTFAKVALMLAGLFAVAFVAGQLLFWGHLVDEGHSVNVNPALSFFYLFTGLHVVHVVIGLMVWLLATHAALKGWGRAGLLTDLCASYWHFLLVLWFGLFALLVSSPETYDAIAAFCGLR